MPLIQPDLSEINKPIEPGTYKAEIVGPVENAVSKADNAMLVIKFEVDVNGKKMKRTVRQVITGAGAFGFPQLLRATGFGDYAEHLLAGGKEPWDSDQLVGQKLQVIIESDTYNGQLTDKIVSYLPA